MPENEGSEGYDGAVFSMALGLRQPVSEDVTLGVMASYEQSSFNGDGGADSDGDSATLGVSATRAYGDMAVTLAAGGSFGVHDVTRSTTGASGPLSARGEYAAWSAALRGRIDYGLRFGGTLVTPALDLDLIHAAADGYRETGAGAFDLKVEDSSETAFRATPSIGIARGFGLGEATTMTLWGTAGVSFSTSDAYVATARFASSPGWQTMAKLQCRSSTTGTRRNFFAKTSTPRVQRSTRACARCAFSLSGLSLPRESPSRSFVKKCDLRGRRRVRSLTAPTPSTLRTRSWTRTRGRRGRRRRRPGLRRAASGGRRRR